MTGGKEIDQGIPARVQFPYLVASNSVTSPETEKLHERQEIGAMEAFL